MSPKRHPSSRKLPPSSRQRHMDQDLHSAISDDEEIDEDEAFNSDDERKYGVFFERKCSADQDSEEDDESEDDEASSDNPNDDDEDSAHENSYKSRDVAVGSVEAELAEEGSDCFSSDDDESQFSEDDDVEEERDEDDRQYMLNLLDKIGSPSIVGGSRSTKKEETWRHDGGIAAHTRESEFNASVIMPKAKMTLDTLMKGLENTAGFGDLQKQLKKVVQGTATPAPVAKIVSERTKRKVHYADQSVNMNYWIPAVQENRQAETLDFRPKQRLEITKDVMVETFVPTTDFEKQIHAALVEAGQQDEEAILRAEQKMFEDDLGSHEITLEEYKKRQGQLAKYRSLMFSQEQKNHQMKKIKSKTYRRIHKRQRDRLKQIDLEARAANDEQLVRELEEKEETERMKERMTLVHKNTSKWAKRILKRGKSVDVDTRRALSAQLKRGDDLLQRMNSTRAGSKDDSVSDSDEDSVEAARKVLSEIESNQEPNEEPKGLFKLAFMQRGVERQRQQARDEARGLLRELERKRNDDASIEADDFSSSDEEEKEEIKSKGVSKTIAASKEEMKHILGEDQLVVSQLKLGNLDATAISDDIEIDNCHQADNQVDKKKIKKKNDANTIGEDKITPALSVYDSTIAIDSTHDLAVDAQTDSPSHKHCNSDHKRKAESMPLKEVNTSFSFDTNPWINSPEMNVNKSEVNKVKKRKSAAGNYAVMVNVERAIDLVQPHPTMASISHPVQLSNMKNSSSKDVATIVSPKSIMHLSQDELVHRAFATIQENEIDEEFAQEKAAVAADEDPAQKYSGKQKPRGNLGVDGWGSWAGKGAPPALPPRKLPKKLAAPEKKPLPPMNRADEKRSHVIFSEKRLKKLADKFMINEVPFPFTCREDYERSMAGGVGKEWNVSSSFKDMTRPEVMTRMGKVIQPLSMKAKQKRPAAKF